MPSMRLSTWPAWLMNSTAPSSTSRRSMVTTLRRRGARRLSRAPPGLEPEPCARAAAEPGMSDGRWRPRSIAGGGATRLHSDILMRTSSAVATVRGREPSGDPARRCCRPSPSATAKTDSWHGPRSAAGIRSRPEIVLRSNWPGTAPAIPITRTRIARHHDDADRDGGDAHRSGRECRVGRAVKSKTMPRPAGHPATHAAGARARAGAAPRRPPKTASGPQLRRAEPTTLASAVRYQS